MEQQTDTRRLAAQTGEALGRLMGEIMQHSARDILCLLQREDLSMPRMTALMMLSRRGTASISDISKHLNLSLGATSHLVDKLVESGFVTRAEDPEDRRQKHVALTERGRAFAQEVRRVRVEEVTRRLEHLPAPLLASSLATLDELLACLRSADGD
jgi:DNA-binding MarR family transcriptional regulator